MAVKSKSYLEENLSQTEVTLSLKYQQKKIIWM